MESGVDGLTEDFVLPVESASISTGSQPVYVSFTRVNPDEYPSGSFSGILKFISKEVDPSSGMPEETGYPDEYPLDEVELSAGGDYIVPSYTSFDSEWEKLAGDHSASAEEEFALSSMASIKGMTRSTITLLLYLHNLTDSTFTNSCVRIPCGSFEYGGAGRVRSSDIYCCAHSSSLRLGWWWRWQSLGEMSDGVHRKFRCLITVECSGGKRGSGAASNCGHWLILLDLKYIFSTSIRVFFPGIMLQLCRTNL
jgi:hypothetical protein